MACIPSPTLTLYSTSTSSTVITTSTVVAQTQADGSVSTLTLPLIVTSIVTVVNPTSTLFASCSDSSTPISTIPSSLTSSQPSSSATPQPTPTIVIQTTTPPPTVVTAEQSSTLGNGVVTVVTIISTSTPPPTVIAVQTSVVSPQPTPTPKSSSSNVALIAGGAVGGFFFLVGLVAVIWFILKKCRKAGADREDEDVVFPYPVTRDRDQTRRLDLARESRPYEYGLVGRSTPMTDSGSSPGLFNHSRPSDARRDSATALIGSSSGGLPPMASASANVAPIQGTQSRGADVGRQPSHSSAHQLPPGAAPPGAAPGAAPPHDYYSPSVTGSGSVSGSSATGGPPIRRPLQVINPPLSPMSMRYSNDMSGSGSAPMVVPEPERSSMYKMPTQDIASSSGAIHVHSDGGRIEGGDRRPSVSGSGAVPERKPPAQPVPTSEEPIDAPPAYAE